MESHLTSTVETPAGLVQEQHSEAIRSDGLVYSAEDLSAYYYELEGLLVQVEKAETHYEVLGIDHLATTGEITTAYFRAMLLLDPASHGLVLDLPETPTPRVALASERVSEAFGTLMDFEDRQLYDGRLFGWENEEQNEPVQQGGKSKSKVSPKTKTDARRSRQRFEIPIPVEVMGYDQNASDWHEVVQSLDLSRSGACILLRRRVLVGNVLYLRLQMPMVLRAHEYIDPIYGTYGIVRWIRPPRDGFRLVGVQFIGELPPLGFRERPWATFHIGKWDGADRREELRTSVSEAIEIEYFDEAEQFIKKDSGFLEDLSASGVRVCAQHPPLEGDLIRITRPKLSLSKYALVRNRFKGRDGYERLCAQFVSESAGQNTNVLNGRLDQAQV